MWWQTGWLVAMERKACGLEKTAATGCCGHDSGEGVIAIETIRHRTERRVVGEEY